MQVIINWNKCQKSRYFFLLFKLTDIVFILLINIKMPIIVGILTFMSRMNSMLSIVVLQYA